MQATKTVARWEGVCAHGCFLFTLKMTFLNIEMTVIRVNLLYRT